jgi:DNA-binding helix-hairpin-helix protein with protein kinase domain
MAGSGHVSIAWPADRLLAADGSRTVVGCLLPRVDGALPVFEFYNPRSRLRLCPLFHYGYLLRTARNLTAAVRALHDRDYVVGDLNETNVLVTNQALVTLIDTDSFQVHDRGRAYRCPVGKAEYTPPELQRVRFADFDRGPEHDAFALAVLVFQLLMQGIHPFAGRLTEAGDAADLAERIALGQWPYARSRPVPYQPSPHAPPFATLPPPVQELMRRCFEDGHARSGRRPTAAEWQEALADAEPLLATCPANDQHVYHNGLAACPWCALARRLGRDPFPARPPAQADLTTSVALPPRPAPVTGVAARGTALPRVTRLVLPPPRSMPLPRPDRARRAAPPPLPRRRLAAWRWLIGLALLAVLGALLWAGIHQAFSQAVPHTPSAPGREPAAAPGGGRDTNGRTREIRWPAVPLSFLPHPHVKRMQPR